MRLRLLAAATAGLACAVAATAAAAADWPRYGVDAARSNASPAATGITAANVATLRRQRVRLDGTVDSSPIYLHAVRAGARARDLLVVTTTYGKTIALDAASGAVVWRFVPAGISGWAGSPQITTASPVADPGRAYVYAASPDGRIHKLSLANGREAGGAWPISVTRDPTHEKLSTALNVNGPYLYVTMGGYYGDAPPYQGKVVAIDRASGRIAGVFNALCSDRREIIVPSTCPASDAAIWARAGAVVEASGNLLVATGNGPFDGRRNWGDSVLELSPTGALLQSWTPANADELERNDTDLGSTAPAILTPSLAIQGGKDGLLRLLDLRRLNGRGGAGPAKGGELQTLRVTGSVFTTPAVLHAGGKAYAFVGTNGGLSAYVLDDGSAPRLRELWSSDRGSTSPVLAGGLLYAYDPGGGLRILAPLSGRLLATLPAGPGHWNSPIVADGRVILPEGDANAHAETGVLDVYRLPGKR